MIDAARGGGALGVLSWGYRHPGNDTPRSTLNPDSYPGGRWGLYLKNVPNHRFGLPPGEGVTMFVGWGRRRLSDNPWGTLLTRAEQAAATIEHHCPDSFELWPQLPEAPPVFHCPNCDAGTCRAVFCELGWLITVLNAHTREEERGFVPRPPGGGVEVAVT